jgi:hypothetical protein
MKSFLQRHASSIEGVLSGFDRLRFRGTVRILACVSGMRAFLSQMHVLLKDFPGFAEESTKKVCTAVENVAESAGRPVQYLASPKASKEEMVDRLVREEGPGKGGVIAVFSCVELCQSYVVYRNRELRELELRCVPRKCLHHYIYLQDPMFGRIHVRMQSWFPFNVHICMNGREWLSRQMDAAGIDYLRKDNCFVRIHDFPRAQKMLQRQVRIDWVKHLDRLLNRANPVLARLFTDFPPDYYWSAEQTEWATDVVFRQAADLAVLYPQLIDHGIRLFGSQDVMRFLGRKVPATGGCHGNFLGEVVSDLCRRPEGLRIKHRVNRNALKMYDKQGSVLRVETTINDARDLKSYRTKEGDPKGKKSWRRLRKGVSDLPRRVQLSQAANGRYLEALAAVESETSLKTLAEKVCQPAMHNQRRVRALNPLSADDARLMQAVQRGEFKITGFRNRDLRPLLFDGESLDAAQRRKQSGQVSRKLVLLQGHGLIRKIPKTHRYLPTKLGTQTIAAFLAAGNASVEKLTASAA